jgi:general secretion pathway protein D
MTLPAFAQEEESQGVPAPTMRDPDFLPPPPPNFIPGGAPTEVPTRTPTPPSRMRSQSPTPAPAPAPDAAAATVPSEEVLLQRESAIINPENPRMREVVGLIRIPEMGTNEVLEMLENFTGKPILRQQTLPAVKITFYSQDAMTRGEAITAIESLLALNGVAITNVGTAFLKAVPASVVNAQVPRVWEGSTLDAIPSQTIYEKIFELDFLTPEEASAILQPLMSQGSPVSFAKSNFILITDALINLQRIERLLPVLDKPAELKTKMLFYELQNIEAQEVVRRLQTIITGPLRRQLENNTFVEADERTNQLLIFTHPSNQELIDSLIERLDISVAPNTATKVYSIRYAEATEVVSIIDQIVSGQREVQMETGGTGDAAAQAARQRTAQLRQLNQAAASVRAEATNLQFSSFLTIVPDERANTIVANGTHTDLQYLEQLINEIDTLLAQVRIEVVIAEVTLSDNDTRGIDSLGFAYSGTGFDVDFNDPTSQSTFSPGNFYGVTFGDGISWGPDEAFSFEVILNSIAQNSNAKVLSAPTIVTTHNKEATVSVGQEQPVITGTTTSDLSSGLSTREQVQYRDIKLELKVTPLIGSDGIVQMEIEQQNQSITGTVLVNGNPQPIIGTRTANSYVSVKDRGLIALGGLQSLTSRDSNSRMAILGKIPVLGDLFSRTTTEMERTELLIFIRPTIIRDAEDADQDANKLIDGLEGTKEVRDYLDEGTFRVPEEAPSGEKEVPRRNKP